MERFDENTQTELDQLVTLLFQADSVGESGYILVKNSKQHVSNETFSFLRNSRSRYQRLEDASKQLTVNDPNLNSARNWGPKERRILGAIRSSAYSAVVVVGGMGSGKSVTTDFVIEKTINNPALLSNKYSITDVRWIKIILTREMSFDDNGKPMLEPVFRRLFDQFCTQVESLLANQEKLVIELDKLLSENYRNPDFSGFQDFIRKYLRKGNSIYRKKAFFDRAEMIIEWIRNEKSVIYVVERIAKLAFITKCLSTLTNETGSFIGVFIDNLDMIHEELQAPLQIVLMNLSKSSELKIVMTVRSTNYEYVHAKASITYNVVQHNPIWPSVIIETRLNWLLNTIETIHNARHYVLKTITKIKKWYISQSSSIPGLDQFKDSIPDDLMNWFSYDDDADQNASFQIQYPPEKYFDWINRCIALGIMQEHIYTDSFSRTAKWYSAEYSNTVEIRKIIDLIPNEDLDHVTKLINRLSIIFSGTKDKNDLRLINTLNWLSGSSIRRALLISQNFIINSILRTDEAESEISPDKFIRALLVGNDEDGQLGNGNDYVHNIFCDPLKRRITLRKIRILDYLNQFSKNNRRGTRTFKSIMDFLECFGYDDIDSNCTSLNRLMHHGRRLVWAEGLQEFPNQIEVAETKLQKLHLTVAGQNYLEKLIFELRYLQECFKSASIKDDDGKLYQYVGDESLDERFKTIRYGIRELCQVESEELSNYNASIGRLRFLNWGYTPKLVSHKILISVSEAFMRIASYYAHSIDVRTDKSQGDFDRELVREELINWQSLRVSESNKHEGELRVRHEKTKSSLSDLIASLSKNPTMTV